jgi:hypothetical protein
VAFDAIAVYAALVIRAAFAVTAELVRSTSRYTRAAYAFLAICSVTLGVIVYA